MEREEIPETSLQSTAIKCQRSWNRGPINIIVLLIHLITSSPAIVVTCGVVLCGVLKAVLVLLLVGTVMVDPLKIFGVLTNSTYLGNSDQEGHLMGWGTSTSGGTTKGVRYT